MPDDTSISEKNDDRVTDYQEREITPLAMAVMFGSVGNLNMGV